MYFYNKMTFLNKKNKFSKTCLVKVINNPKSEKKLNNPLKIGFL